MARHQVPHVADRSLVVESFSKSRPAVEKKRGARIELCSKSSISLQKVSERLKHLAVPSASLETKTAYYSGKMIT